MKRLVLFIVALVFVFCTTVMAAEPAAAPGKKEAYHPVYKDSFTLPAIPAGCKIAWNEGQVANEAVHGADRMKNGGKYPDYYLFNFKMTCNGSIMEKGSLTAPYYSKPVEYTVESNGSLLEFKLQYMPRHNQDYLIKYVSDATANNKQLAAKYSPSFTTKSFKFPGWDADGYIFEDKNNLGGFTFVGIGENKILLDIKHGYPFIQFKQKAGAGFWEQKCINNGNRCSKEESKSSDDFVISEQKKRIVKYQEQQKKWAFEFLSGMRLKGLDYHYNVVSSPLK